VQPVDAIFPSFEPPPRDRGIVGIGQPIAVIFDKAPPTGPPPNVRSPHSIDELIQRVS